MSLAGTVTNDDSLELRHAWYQVDPQFEGSHGDVVFAKCTVSAFNIPSIASDGVHHSMPVVLVEAKPGLQSEDLESVLLLWSKLEFTLCGACPFCHVCSVEYSTRN